MEKQNRSIPGIPGRDRVFNWKVWNAEKVTFAGASEGIISGTGTCWEVK